MKSILYSVERWTSRKSIFLLCSGVFGLSYSVFISIVSTSLEVFMLRVMHRGLFPVFMSLLFIVGCSSEFSISERACVLLSDKYSTAFSVYAIGNRYGTDTATVYAYADADPSMLFTARVSDDGVLAFDNYAYRSVCRKAEQMVVSIFSEQGVEVVCFCSFDSFDNTISPGLAVVDFIDMASVEWLTVSLVIRNGSNVSGVSILTALEKLRSCLGVNVGSWVFVVSSVDFDRVRDTVLLETQSFDKDRLCRRGIQDEVCDFTLQVYSGGATMAASEIDVELGRVG